MQIEDLAVSQRSHTYLVFDPETQRFVIAPGDSRGLTWVRCDGGEPQLLTEPRELVSGDEIHLGKTKPRLIALCTPTGFQWAEPY